MINPPLGLELGMSVVWSFEFMKSMSEEASLSVLTLADLIELATQFLLVKEDIDSVTDSAIQT